MTADNTASAMTADGTPSSSSSGLLTLPLEVLLTVASHLSTPEYGHLRLTCKHLETSFFSSFSREFFSKRQFMLTEFSLQALVDISRSRLSPSMTHVIISLDRPAPTALHSALASVHAHDPANSNYVNREYIDHLSLINSGHDVDMMAEAFGNLPNLDAVGLRDFDSRSRYRDGTEWKSYGAAKFMKATGYPLNSPAVNLGGMWGRASADNWPVYHSHVFLGILRALNKAAARPRSFQVILRHKGLDDHVFNLPKFVHVQPILAELHTLFLDLHEDHAPIAVDSGDGLTHIDCPNYLLRGFLGHLSQLRHLRLNFRSVGRRTTEDLLSWLARPAVSTISAPQPNNGTPDAMFPKAPLPVDFPHLTELDIGMATVNAAVLLGLARKFCSSLQRLELHRISLRETATGRDSDKKINHWAKFLGKLSKIDTKLTGLVLSSVSQEKTVEGTRPDKIRVQFKDSSATRDSIRWAGQDLDGGLKDITNSMLVLWPEEGSDDSSMEDVDDIEESEVDEVDSAAEGEDSDDAAH